MKRTLYFLTLLTFPLLLNSQSVWTNVVVHGADPSGRIKCTNIINSLIDSMAMSGGGTLFFPAGTFLTGPVVMKSNITLYLDAGSVIKFSDDFDDYLPMVLSRWEEVRVKNFKSQIYAYQCENIAIRGDGHLDGQGKKWWDFMRNINAGQNVDSRWQQIFIKENELLLSKNQYIKGKPTEPIFKIIKTIEVIRENQGIVDEVISVVDRESGAKEKIKQVDASFIPLLSASEILKK